MRRSSPGARPYDDSAPAATPGPSPAAAPTYSRPNATRRPADTTTIIQQAVRNVALASIVPDSHTSEGTVPNVIPSSSPAASPLVERPPQAITRSTTIRSRITQ